MSILVSGSLAYDHIMNFPDSFRNHILPEQLHILSVCFMIDRLEKTWGGTAGNIAFTLKMLGAEPIILSAVGKDGAEYTNHFERLAISTKYIVRNQKQLTASAYVTTDADDNQITAFYNGPLGDAAAYHLRDVSEPASVVVVSPTHKAVMVQHLKEAHELGLKAVFDPGQQLTAFNEAELRRMISQAYFVIGNDYEVKLLEERSGWSAGEILQNTQVLITTLGERGSVIATREGETIEVGVCPPRSFDDPTGAGDAYRAGFFAAFERGFDYKTCGQIGSVAASYAIETYGTQEHAFTTEEFVQRYKKAFNEDIAL